MAKITFTTDQLSQDDRNVAYRLVSQVEDHEAYFKDDPEYKSLCDLLIRLAYFKTKGYITFEQLKLHDGSYGTYHKVKEGIDFDEWDYDELNDGGGLCLMETYSKYGLNELEPILQKY